MIKKLYTLMLTIGAIIIAIFYLIFCPNKLSQMVKKEAELVEELKDLDNYLKSNSKNNTNTGVH